MCNLLACPYRAIILSSFLRVALAPGSIPGAGIMLVVLVLNKGKNRLAPLLHTGAEGPRNAQDHSGVFLSDVELAAHADLQSRVRRGAPSS